MIKIQIILNVRLNLGLVEKQLRECQLLLQWEKWGQTAESQDRIETTQLKITKQTNLIENDVT